MEAVLIAILSFKVNLLKERFEESDPENCFISEITLAELLFGVENSEMKEKNRKALDDFLYY